MLAYVEVARNEPNITKEPKDNSKLAGTQQTTYVRVQSVKTRLHMDIRCVFNI